MGTKLSDENGNATLFNLPNNCPNVTLSICSNFEHTSSVVLEPLDDEQDLNLGDNGLNFASNPVTPKQKGKAKMKPPLSKADVRRSQRLKLINKGFKSSSYKDKICLGCSSTPPTISPKVIRNLGASFCGIDPNELTTSKLNAKPTKKKKSVKKSEGTSLKNTSQNSSDEG